MKKNFVPHIILFFILITFFSAQSSEVNWKYSKKGNTIIFIRHALAPGGGDPQGFDLKNCKTQRNLNSVGINQSKKIGLIFKKNKIPIDKVLSSQWCRCKDTAKYAFGKFYEFSALNSTFQSPFDKNEDKQIEILKNFVKNWNGKGKNLVLVTHYSIITAITTAVPSSGEIVVTDKNFNVLETINTD